MRVTYNKSLQDYAGDELKSCCDSMREAQDELKEIQYQDEMDRLAASLRIEDLPFF